MTIPLAYQTFSNEDILAFEPAMKIGLLATVTPEGLPHLTMISSLKAGSDATLTWGQFTEGVSKQYVHNNPKTAFLIMTLDKRVWRGKARWTHAAQGGPEYEWYNNVPMFRYNAYFGIHTVHFMDLLGHTGQQPLPMNAIIAAAIQSVLASKLLGRRADQPVMNLWTRTLFNKLDNLKFLAWVNEDGYPWIIPVIQAQAKDSQHLVISTGAFGDELAILPPGIPVAVLGLALTMEDVLVRGKYLGIERRAGMRCAVVKTDWAYNPMPPVPGQIYPPLALETVTRF